MFRNPFKKPAQDNPIVSAATLIEGTPRLMLLGSSRTHDQLPQNDELEAAMQTLRRAAQIDHGAMWRALLRASLWVPVFDADLESAEGRRVHAMVFREETAFYAFTSPEHIRIAFRGSLPVEGDTLSVALVSGQTACDMAANFGVEKLLVNPNSPDEMTLPPLAFRVLARNFVPANPDSPIPHGEAQVMRPVVGLPPEPALGALRDVLKRHNALAAYWLLNFWEQPDDYAQLFYALAVDCDTEHFLELHLQLVQAWRSAAPFPTALLPLPLRALDEGLQTFARERCDQLFP